MAACEAVVDIPAGFFGASTHEGQNRVPIIGAVEAAIKDAGDIVVGVAGYSVYEDRRNNKKAEKKRAKKEKKRKKSQRKK